MIRRHTCPVCEREFTLQELPQAPFPFCSSRCRQVDLLRWCEGQYAIVQNLDPVTAEMMRYDPDIHVDEPE